MQSLCDENEPGVLSLNIDCAALDVLQSNVVVPRLRHGVGFVLGFWQLLQPRSQLFGDVGMRGQAIFKFRFEPALRFRVLQCFGAEVENPISRAVI